jgi:hypothetical protein
MAKKAPSFPNLTDEYEPTNSDLWEKVKAVARGDEGELTIGTRTITRPSGYVWPSPPASAWAVKQYKGFGGGWRKTSALKILEAGGIVTTTSEAERHRMQRLVACGMAQPVGEDMWEGGPKASPGNRVASRWKQALEALDPKGLKQALTTAARRTRDFPAKVTKFEVKKGRDGQWSAEAWVGYKYPTSKIPIHGKTPTLPSLHMTFNFDPTKALSIKADAKSPLLGSTKKIYENHRVTGDYERTVRSVLLSYQPEVAWK